MPLSLFGAKGTQRTSGSTITTETDEAPSGRNKSLSVKALRKAQGKSVCSEERTREGCLLSFVRDHAVSLEPEPLQDKIQPVMGEAFPGKATSLL